MNYIDGDCNMKTNKFYRAYRAILQRCNNKNCSDYKFYGGRGIKCLWKSYEDFKRDMYHSYFEHNKKYGGRNTSIERIDVDGHYCKDNCKWATQKEQAYNRTNTKKIKYEGKEYTLSQLSSRSKVSRCTFYDRMLKGWTVNDAINVKCGYVRPVNKKWNWDFLNHRQQLVLRLRYSGFTLQKVGNEIGVTRERARQLIKKAELVVLDKTR